MAETTRKPYTVIALRHGGTHLISPIVRGLTDKTVYSPKGRDALLCQPSPVVIVFLRDPRNWLISFYRWKIGEITDVALARFMVTERKDFSPLAYLEAWSSRWVECPGALIVRFEDFRPEARGIEEVTRIAAFLGAGREPAKVYRDVYGKSGTFTGEPSDWRASFGPKSTRTWIGAGGPALAARMGYPE